MTAINLNTDSLTLTIQEAGEANTNSKAGGTAGLVNTKSGINTPIKGLTGGTNITVTEGTNEVTIGVTNDYDNIDVAPKPDVDATHSLGSITKTWSDLYLKGYSIQNANSRIEMGSTDNKAVLWEQAGNAFELDTGGADITLRTNSGNNVIVPENLVVNGSLDVNGTLTTIDTTNTAIADRIIELNRGATSNANDIGIVMERGSAGDNATIFWDESADTFRIATTTSDGTETGSMDGVTNAALSASMVTANLTGNVTGNLTGNVTGDVTGDLTGDVTGNIASTGNSSFSGTVNLNGATVNNAAFNLSGNLTGNSAGTHTGAVSGTTVSASGGFTGNVAGNVTGNLTGNSAGTHTGAVIGNVTGNVTGNLDGLIGETTRATGKFTTVDANGNVDGHRGSFTSGINANSTDYASSNFMIFDNTSIAGATSALTMVRYLGSDGADTTGFDPRGATFDWEIRSDSGNTNGSATNIYPGGISGYVKHDNDAHQMHFFVYDDGHSSYTRQNAFWFDKNHIVVEREAEFLSNVSIEGDTEIDFQDANGTLRVNDNDGDQIFELDKERLNLDLPIQMKVYNVNDLPTTLDEGAIAYVTDESTVTGGGCMVFYNGGGWSLMHDPSTTASS